MACTDNDKAVYTILLLINPRPWTGRQWHCLRRSRAIYDDVVVTCKRDSTGLERIHAAVVWHVSDCREAA